VVEFAYYQVKIPFGEYLEHNEYNKKNTIVVGR
jgi:hypothetical protein